MLPLHLICINQLPTRGLFTQAPITQAPSNNVFEAFANGLVQVPHKKRADRRQVSYDRLFDKGLAALDTVKIKRRQVQCAVLTISDHLCGTSPNCWRLLKAVA